MGVGKGSTARALSRYLHKYTIDSDDLIQTLTNQKIKEIFKKSGEKKFREIEQFTANWIQNSVKDTIISVGGGFYKVDNIKKLGKIVYLKASFDWIYNRLKSAKNSKNKFKKRPLFYDIQKARELYNSRVSEYEKIADIIIDVQNLTTQEVCEVIKNEV